MFVDAVKDWQKGVESKLMPVLPRVPKEGSAYSFKAILLKEGEQLLVEPGAMLAFHNLSMKIEQMSTIFGSIKKYFLGGESFWVNRYTALSGGGWLALEEQFEGQIVEVCLKKSDNGFKIYHGAFTAATANIKLQGRYEGLVGWFKGKGYGSVQASLTEGEEGKIYIGTDAGQVKVIRVREGNPIFIDNEHILAHSGGLNSTIRKGGNIKTLIFGGEGFINEFNGDGVVFVGSGAITGHATWLKRFADKVYEAFYEDMIPNGVVFLAGVVGAAVGSKLSNYLSFE